MEMEHILNSIPYTVHVWKKVPPLSVKDQPKGDRIDIPFHLSYAKQQIHRLHTTSTLPEINIAQQNQCLEYELPFLMAYYQVRTVSGRVL